jgi:osmotically-inducible protein OsmY
MHGPLHDDTLDHRPGEYLIAHVQEALASHDGVSELGIGVSLAGGRMFLTGTVASEEQRARAATVAAEVAEGLDVCNDLEVVQLTGEPTTERLT